MKRIIFAVILTIICLLYYIPKSLCQDSTQYQSDYESSIKISGRVDQKRVPLNRFLNFTVKVEWVGEIGRYQISELEDPILENFEIYSTSSADHRMNEGGVDKAARIYAFSLRPETLGMGYIEGVMVKYIDNKTGEGHHLVTNRIDVEVIESVPEPGSKKSLIVWGVVIALIVIVLIVLLYWFRRKKQRRLEETAAVQVIPLEEEFLTTLHETIDLKQQDLNINETFWDISKLFRKYLSQKHQFPAMEYTTDQIMTELLDKQHDERELDDIKEILDKCDLVKFAGAEGKRPELERVYTLVESVLENNLAKQNNQDEHSKNED